MNIKLMTSESVTEGHPDKVCDQISDGILDEMLKKDPESHAAVESFATNGMIVVGGEVRTKEYIQVDDVVRKVLKSIGYDGAESGFDCDSVGIMSSLHAQSAEIAHAYYCCRRIAKSGPGFQTLRCQLLRLFVSVLS